MKLLYCNSCGDIQLLMIGVPRICMCQETSGYLDDQGLNAHVFGPSADVLGFSNRAFGAAKFAHQAHPEGAHFITDHEVRLGWTFDAFFIPRIGEEHHVRREIQQR